MTAWQTYAVTQAQATGRVNNELQRQITLSTPVYPVPKILSDAPNWWLTVAANVAIATRQVKSSTNMTGSIAMSALDAVPGPLSHAAVAIQIGLMHPVERKVVVA